MRKKTYVLMLTALLFGAGLVHAQNRAIRIEKRMGENTEYTGSLAQPVSYQTIADILSEEGFISHFRTDDNPALIAKKEGITLTFRLSEEHDYVLILTGFRKKDRVDSDQRVYLRAVNLCNKRAKFCTFFVDGDGDVQVSSFVLCQQGLQSEQLLQVVKKFETEIVFNALFSGLMDYLQ